MQLRPSGRETMIVQVEPSLAVSTSRSVPAFVRAVADCVSWNLLLSALITSECGPQAVGAWAARAGEAIATAPRSRAAEDFATVVQWAHAERVRAIMVRLLGIVQRTV